MSKELKALEQLKYGYKNEDLVAITRSAFERNIDIIEKSLKALEIIKPFLLANDYLYLWEIGFIKGTPEEYQLVKEVLK